MNTKFDKYIFRIYHIVTRWHGTVPRKCVVGHCYERKTWEIQIYIPEVKFSRSKVSVRADTALVIHLDRIELAFVILGFGAGLWIKPTQTESGVTT